ncbi:Aggregation promoting factor [Pediococcus damnosus]|uniref:Aggregation promoting factor n=1 Tax=Pediococcus damnosus TaxID=51663 RepID=A0A0R2HNS7_9LACO|nr:LysM peptidoglycan-binding domain-containing protein [Pediococcus damnosus]AMV62769.1 Aggregation promoting factor [Pediococcus damnosus]AMV67346.1 Aggregation promoting factor [Pediococcus damnosus]AMV69648.1 Aggregation promoting factor [Pediococcus damnosus]KJU75168.1 peptidase M23B [Pediococcus damnosus LMG 28219]KRN51575.1 aggregation promoting factor-like surface protein [Pediococcus damnosus]
MTLRSKITKFSVALLSTVTLGSTVITAAAHADSVYTVKSGDTLSGIAYDLNKNNDYSALATANKIKNVNLIYVGQKLLIKSDGEVKVATKSEVKSTPAVKSIASTTQNSSAKTQSANTNTASSQSSNTASKTTTSTTNGGDSSAKAWIANKESGGSYTATNGQYVGKYQLSSSYLHGDYSAANQEKVANSYVSSRYGSWSAAKSFWQANGWY